MFPCTYKNLSVTSAGVSPDVYFEAFTGRN